MAITAGRKVGRWGGKARTGALKEAVEQIGARERERKQLWSNYLVA